MTYRTHRTVPIEGGMPSRLVRAVTSAAGVAATVRAIPENEATPCFEDRRFTGKHETEPVALLKICRTICPVRAECLAQGKADKSPGGMIWGGVWFSEKAGGAA